MPWLVGQGANLRLTDVDAAIATADMVFISVNTPTKVKGLEPARPVICVGSKLARVKWPRQPKVTPSWWRRRLYGRQSHPHHPELLRILQPMVNGHEPSRCINPFLAEGGHP